jgi:hypothetical protein
MYRVPPSHTRDPRLGRAITLAVVLCSLGASMLSGLLIELRVAYSALIGLAIYFGMLGLCWLGATLGWIKALYTLAIVGALLVGISGTIWVVPAFQVTRRIHWSWDNLSFPVTAILFSPVYVLIFWLRSKRRA